MNRGCFKCGSERLKAAPLPIVSAILKPFWKKRRYRCADCGETTWRHRLQRRNTALPSLAPKTTPGAPAIAFLIIVLAVLITSGIALTRSCEERAPVETGSGN